MRSTSRVWVLSCALGLCSWLALQGSLDAQPRPRAPTPIALGTFASGREVDSTLLESALRSALRSHPSLALSPDRARARFLVTGSVVELSERAVGSDEHEVRCRVSIVVADARGGAVRAMLEGRAGVRGGGSDEAMRRSAVRGAAESALRSLATLR